MRYLMISAIVALFFSSCSKNGNSGLTPPTEPVINPATLSTEATTNILSNGCRFNGTLLNNGGGTIHSRGFCWSLNTNPTTNDNFMTADGSGNGAYFKDISNALQPNTTYNVRAYAINEKGPAYGNNITFTTKDFFDLTTQDAKDIGIDEATVSGSIGSTYYGSVTKKGFCFSTSSTPTLNNGTVIFVNDNQLNNFTADLTGLNRNTTYYVRSFGYMISSQVFYGPVVNFKTTGYAGTSGGYVFFDKGSVSNGWRYLEAAPADISFSGGFTTKWGCSTALVAQTSKAVGTGLENTNRIVANCQDGNCAARLCYDYNVNGISDWFLGSADEMALLYDNTSSLLSYGSQQVYWTSSEYNSSNALNFNMIYGASSQFGVSKANNGYVRAIRRF